MEGTRAQGKARRDAPRPRARGASRSRPLRPRDRPAPRARRRPCAALLRAPHAPPRRRPGRAWSPAGAKESLGVVSLGTSRERSRERLSWLAALEIELEPALKM